MVIRSWWWRSPTVKSWIIAAMTAMISVWFPPSSHPICLFSLPVNPLWLPPHILSHRPLSTVVRVLRQRWLWCHLLQNFCWRSRQAEKPKATEEPDQPDEPAQQRGWKKGKSNHLGEGDMRKEKGNRRVPKVRQQEPKIMLTLAHTPFGTFVEAQMIWFLF